MWMHVDQAHVKVWKCVRREKTSNSHLLPHLLAMPHSTSLPKMERNYMLQLLQNCMLHATAVLRSTAFETQVQACVRS